MLYAFKVYYAQNYAGIIRQGLKVSVWRICHNENPALLFSK